MARISVTIDPIDVDLLDRLGRLEGRNRSQELRAVLEEVRPALRAAVEAFEAASRQKDAFDVKVSEARADELEALMEEAERLRDAYLGAMARIEGKQAASEASDPRPSNHGGHTPTPTPPHETL